MRETVFSRNAPWFPISDAGVVTYSVKGAEPVDLIGHAPSLTDARQIADDNCLGAGCR